MTPDAYLGLADLAGLLASPFAVIPPSPVIEASDDARIDVAALLDLSAFLLGGLAALEAVDSGSTDPSDEAGANQVAGFGLVDLPIVVESRTGTRPTGAEALLYLSHGFHRVAHTHPAARDTPGIARGLARTTGVALELVRRAA